MLQCPRSSPPLRRLRGRAGHVQVLAQRHRPWPRRPPAGHQRIRIARSTHRRSSSPAVNAKLNAAHAASPQASGCACVQLWHFNQRSALGALVALIPTPAAEVRALAWCTQSLPASAFPSPPSHPDHEQRSDASRTAPCFFLLAAALSSGEVEVSFTLAPHPSLIHLAFSHVCLQVWSIPSSLIAARCSRALDSRAVAADGFDAWALLRPTVRGTRCTIELEPVLPCMSDLIL